MSYLHIERTAEKIDCPFSMPISMPTDRKEQPPMTKPREKTHKELTAEIEEDEKKKIRQFKLRTPLPEITSTGEIEQSFR